MHTALSVCVLLALGAATAVVAQSGPTPAPRFAVDLDADPLTRWVPIVSQFKDRYAPIVAYLDTMYPPFLQPIFDPILADLDKYIPAPYADELRGVANAINGASGMDLGKILLLNIVYDISAFCTSIAAQTDANGAMIHGRNLDYPFPGLQNITATIDFQRNGVTQYTGTTFVGYVGLLTGVRAQGWSVTVNQRNIPGDSVLDVLQNLLEGVEGAYPVGMRLRSTLETNATFDDAVATLQHVHLWGPVYLTMAGTAQNQGVVITRDRNDPADVWFIDGASTYYRGQTNDDHWQPPLDDRRAAMNEMMAQYNSSSISTSVLYEILSTAPLFNHATRYTTVMNPTTGQCDTTVRFDAPTKAEMDAEGWDIMF